MESVFSHCEIACFVFIDSFSLQHIALSRTFSDLLSKYYRKSPVLLIAVHLKCTASEYDFELKL